MTEPKSRASGREPEQSIPPPRPRARAARRADRLATPQLPAAEIVINISFPIRIAGERLTNEQSAEGGGRQVHGSRLGRGSQSPSPEVN